LPDAVADGFLGFVKRGDSFDYQIWYIYICLEQLNKYLKRRNSNG
jgi:hypothetical protein